jgi:hypothetical protein
MIEFVVSDGGRSKAGMEPCDSDCVVRALANTLNTPYKRIHDKFNEFCKIRAGRYGFTFQGTDQAVPILLLRDFINEFYNASDYEEFVERMSWVEGEGFKMNENLYSGITLNDVPEQGHYIVKTKNHVTAVINGYVYDKQTKLTDEQIGNINVECWWRIYPSALEWTGEYRGNSKIWVPIERG